MLDESHGQQTLKRWKQDFLPSPTKNKKSENFAEDYSFWKKNENDIMQLFSAIL